MTAVSSLSRQGKLRLRCVDDCLRLIGRESVSECFLVCFKLRFSISFILSEEVTNAKISGSLGTWPLFVLCPVSNENWGDEEKLKRQISLVFVSVFHRCLHGYTCMCVYICVKERSDCVFLNHFSPYLEKETWFIHSLVISSMMQCI